MWFTFKHIYILWLLLYSINNYGQILQKHQIAKIDSLIEAMPDGYSEINSYFKESKTDTVLMRYLVNKSITVNYLSGQSFALNQLGRKYRSTSQFNKAIHLHKKGLEVALEANNLELKVFSLNMLSVAYRRTDAIKTALDYNQEALELAETVENPNDDLKKSINVSLNGLGNIYQILEQYDLAISLFKKSMKLEEDLGNQLGLAINHQNIGECQEAKNDIKSALASYRISLAYNEKINNAFGRIICKNSIAKIYIKQSKIDQALALLKPILIASKELGNKFITSDIETSLGKALMHKNRHSEAKMHMLEGLRLAKKHHLPSGISKANLFLSDLTNKQGKYKQALQYYKVAQKYDDEISNIRNLRYVNDMIIRYDTEKKNNQIVFLAKENELVKLKLRKNQTTILIGCIALALLAGIFFILYKQYQLKNEKKLLTLEQTMLRSQMNPHFLFNSLNSIKLYIINNEQKNAVHYLNKFAKLVRKILEASSAREIPLAEELETVELYMNIENIRFSNEINFKIKIAQGFDTHTSKIPSLILQPFLENALWHGLSIKQGDKNITLDVRSADGKIIIIDITDNGIGRAAAQKIKENKILKRKSIGIGITKERLTNFYKDYQNDFHIYFTDLHHKDKSSAGTKVTLHIPIY